MTEASHLAGPSVVRQTVVLAQRNLLHHRRSPALLAQWIATPVVLLVVIDLCFGEIISDMVGADHIGVLVPLVVVEGAALGAITTGVAAYGDVHDGWTNRLRTMPVAIPSVLCARALADLGRVLVQLVAVLLVGAALGFRIPAGPAGLLAFGVVALAFSQIFTWAAIARALAADHVASVSALLMPLFALGMIFSSGLVPTSEQVDAVQPVVRLNPFSTSAELLASLAAGPVDGGAALGTAAWTAVLVPLLVVVSFCRTRRSQAR